MTSEYEPAFPVSTLQYDYGFEKAMPKTVTPGMSIRDYFASQFMARAQSLCETAEGGWDFYNAAQCAYAMADAMLEVRNA